MRVRPRQVLPLGGTLPLLGAAGTRALEQAVAATLPAGDLMRRAGLSVARLALAIAPHAERYWIAAGPGNNGGDGLEAAVQLAAFGKQVDLALLGDPARLPADAAAALVRAREARLSIGTAPWPTSAAAPPGLAIDALLGAGAGRAPGGSLAEAIAALNRLPCPVLSIDLPSGLAPDTGERLGPVVVEADHTLALLALKPGLVTGHGRDLTGTVWLDTLGADAAPHAIAWFGGVDPAGIVRRRHAQNKGSFGDVVVVGGAPSMTGAALLAGRAALAAGAGRVYVDLLDRSPATARLDPAHPELMFRDDWAATAGAALDRATVVCGCGGGEAVGGRLPLLLAEASRLVLDADALNAIARDDGLAEALRRRRAAGRHTVLTPHPLEAARLLGSEVGKVQADRLSAARELADRFDCVVILKGSGTVIAAPGRLPRINATGNASLATAGTGDVLAGWLGGRWAQRRGDDDGDAASETSFRIAAQAVAEHGAAAEPQPPGALRSAELIERLHCAPNRPSAGRWPPSSR